MTPEGRAQTWPELWRQARWRLALFLAALFLAIAIPLGAAAWVAVMVTR